MGPGVTADGETCATTGTTARPRSCSLLLRISTVVISGRQEIWQQVRPAVTIDRPQCIAMWREHSCFAGATAKHGRRQAKAGVTAQSRTATIATATRLRLTNTNSYSSAVNCKMSCFAAGPHHLVYSTGLGDCLAVILITSGRSVSHPRSYFVPEVTQMGTERISTEKSACRK